MSSSPEQSKWACWQHNRDGKSECAKIYNTVTNLHVPEQVHTFISSSVCHRCSQRPILLSRAILRHFWVCSVGLHSWSGVNIASVCRLGGCNSFRNNGVSSSGSTSSSSSSSSSSLG